jgi:glutamate decarboxylase
VLSRHVQSKEVDESEAVVEQLYGTRVMDRPIPRFELPAGEMEAQAAFRLIHDELSLDGTPLLNLATFVTTWMEPEADVLAAESLSKNFIDQEEYPVTAELERRCVSILADLFHAADGGGIAVGTSTIGSSEAIHLGALALKRTWRARRLAADPKADVSRPNLVMSSAVHVTWDKFCRYFEVEPRHVPLAPDRFTIDPALAVAQCDENTIGVVGVLGTTYTGHFEPIAELDAALQELNGRTDWNIGIHVDAASGGFVAPFTQPDLQWDFRLPTVRSINVSGHKYGLVYPGVGWALWRDHTLLPEELIFHDSYLGNDQSTFDLNFSKGSSSIVGQYYNFIRLGRAGYTNVMANVSDLAAYVAARLRADGRLEVISEAGHLPVVTARLVDEDRFNAHDLSARLRGHGWIVPAYTLPADLETETVIRVVVREGLNRNLVNHLLKDINTALSDLDRDPPREPHPHRAGRIRPC